ALAYLLEPLWRRRVTAVAALIAVLGLAGANGLRSWQEGFGLDRAALLDPSDVQTPNLTLGTLRAVSATVAAAVATRPYNFELLSPSDYPTDYKYLLRLRGVPPSHPPVTRKAVVVQPAYLAPTTWPGWVAQGIAQARPR